MGGPLAEDEVSRAKLQAGRPRRGSKNRAGRRRPLSAADHLTDPGGVKENSQGVADPWMPPITLPTPVGVAARLLFLRRRRPFEDYSQSPESCFQAPENHSRSPENHLQVSEFLSRRLENTSRMLANGLPRTFFEPQPSWAALTGLRHNHAGRYRHGDTARS